MCSHDPMEASKGYSFGSEWLALEMISPLLMFSGIAIANKRIRFLRRRVLMTMNEEWRAGRIPERIS